MHVLTIYCRCNSICHSTTIVVAIAKTIIIFIIIVRVVVAIKADVIVISVSWQAAEHSNSSLCYCIACFPTLRGINTTEESDRKKKKTLLSAASEKWTVVPVNKVQRPNRLGQRDTLSVQPNRGALYTVLDHDFSCNSSYSINWCVSFPVKSYVSWTVYLYDHLIFIKGGERE